MKIKTIAVCLLPLILTGCGAAMAVHDSAQGQEYSKNQAAMISPVGWVVPGDILLANIDKPKSTPYSKGAYSEATDLRLILEKTSDGKHSTGSARSAADRLFTYGSYRGKEKELVLAFFPMKPTSRDSAHFYYSFQTSVLTDTYVVYFSPQASFYGKKSLRKH
jgi:hypothetical protein